MEADEFRNVNTVSDHMICDGGRISLLYTDPETYQNDTMLMYEALRAAGWSDLRISNDMKTSILDVGKGARRRPISCTWLNGKALEVVAASDPYFARAITEVHMKCFWVEKTPGSHEAFVDAVYFSKFKFARATFQGVPNRKSRRMSGEKGVRFGNPKSDCHKSIYKAQKEKTGMEVHTKGAKLKRLHQTSNERYQSTKRSQPGITYWQVFNEECRYDAARTLMKSIREAGINICDYFSAVSSVSWERPLHADDAEALDSDQEAWYVETATARLPRQLELGDLF